MTLSIPWLSKLFLISIRLGVVLLFTPIQAIGQLPVHIRLILIFAFSLLITNYTPENTTHNDYDLLLSGLAELANGLILALSINATFAVFQTAGQLIDNATGLNSLALFSPSEHSHEPLTSRLLSMLVVLFFFNLGGHIWLFKGLVYSFLLIPPGSLTLFHGFTPIMQLIASMFSMALMLASPIIMALLIIDFCGAIITRNMPQVNTYFLILPIKIVLGLLLLALMLHYINPLTTTIFEHCFHLWQGLML